jgi:predicted nuclease with TOPRIM domain
MLECFTKINLPRLAVCALVLSLCACETTGDPQQGGLFGWSPKKADARRDDLEQADASAQNQLSAEQAHRQALQGRQTRVSADARRLQNEVNHLLAENSDLENQLSNMLDRTRLSAAELQRLKGLLSDNKRLRQQLSNAPAGSEATAPEALNTQNQKLHREVLALLGR